MTEPIDDERRQEFSAWATNVPPRTVSADRAPRDLWRLETVVDLMERAYTHGLAANRERAEKAEADLAECCKRLVASELELIGRGPPL